MNHFAKFVFVFAIMQLIFITPFVIGVETHTLFYETWLLKFSGYLPEYFSINEILIAQRSIMGDLFFSLPSNLKLTEREIIHIHDVVILLKWLYVYVTALLMIIGALLFSKIIRKFTITQYFRKIISFLVLGSVLIFILGYIFFFDALFIFFHKAVFTNDFWQLPKNALLINIYPPQFFYHMLLAALTLSLILYILFITISIMLERIYGNKN